MFLCLLVQLISLIGAFPVYITHANATDPIEMRTENETVVIKSSSNETTLLEDVQLSSQNRFDTSIYIGLKENDWRDAHPGRMIIWSLESHHHPEYGKNYAKGKDESFRMTKSSQLMSFMILGSVIGFILYTYLSHVLMMRKINREEQAAQLRELIKRSALMMAGADEDGIETSGRRRSLINMFKGFRL